MGRYRNQPNRSPPKELHRELRRARSPLTPQSFYYTTRSCVLSSTLDKKIFFYFFYIYPLLLYHTFGSQVKYFSKTFLKKFLLKQLQSGQICDIIIIEKMKKERWKWNLRGHITSPLNPPLFYYTIGSCIKSSVFT